MRRRMDAKRKLQEIAALDLGGAPDDYEVGERARVPARQPRARPDATRRRRSRAIALGGRFDGHELPARHQRRDEDRGRRHWPASG